MEPSKQMLIYSTLWLLCLHGLSKTILATSPLLAEAHAIKDTRSLQLNFIILASDSQSHLSSSTQTSSGSPLVCLSDSVRYI